MRVFAYLSYLAATRMKQRKILYLNMQSCEVLGTSLYFLCTQNMQSALSTIFSFDFS